jgi:hypothetical protein
MPYLMLNRSFDGGRHGRYTSKTAKFMLQERSLSLRERAGVRG